MCQFSTSGNLKKTVRTVFSSFWVVENWKIGVIVLFEGLLFSKMGGSAISGRWLFHKKSQGREREQREGRNKLKTNKCCENRSLIHPFPTIRNLRVITKSSNPNSHKNP